jgi:CSLREA domain-containing protein
MQHPRLLPLPLPVIVLILVLAACGKDQVPTAPSGPAFDHTAGHKVVNSLADPGDGACNARQCTLREAINDPRSTEITFAPGLTGAITLARPGAGGGRLEIAKQLTITGPSQRIVIRGRIPDFGFPVFRIAPGGPVTFTNLNIRNGGHGILNRGTLTVTNCVLAGNRNGILSTGTLELTNSLVASNRGGVLVSGLGRATLINNRIAGNSGTGIDVSHASVTVTNSTIARNSGGGISNGTGRLTITGTTIVNNSTTGAGGGIFNSSGDPFRRVNTTITLINSTVSGNSAASGGGIANVPDQGGAGLFLTNTTIANNTATQQGGGIFQSCCAPSDEEDQGFIRLTNSLVAQNRAPAGPDVLILQGFLTASFNLIGNGSGSGIRDGENGNQVGSPGAPIDPKLGPLADNGGPTRTRALLAGSPAINAASTPDCPTTDQRGVLRPQGAACDIGSYERRQN